MQEGAQANGGLLGAASNGTSKGGVGRGVGNDRLIEEEEAYGPPKATLDRRAQSYSDFHYAVVKVVEKEEADKIKQQSQEGKGTEVKDDLGFGEWYDGLEDALCEASHDDYKCATCIHFHTPNRSGN